MCSACAAGCTVHVQCVCMCSACACACACRCAPLTAAKAVTHVRRPMLRSPIKHAMKGTSTALRYSRKADLEAEVHCRPTSCSVRPDTSHSASSAAARSKPVCGASAKRVARVRPIARARQVRQALSVAVVTAASVNRRLLMRVSGASLAAEAQTRVLTIACCEPQMTVTALSASRAGNRPRMQSVPSSSTSIGQNSRIVLDEARTQNLQGSNAHTAADSFAGDRSNISLPTVRGIFRCSGLPPPTAGTGRRHTWIVHEA